MATKTKQAEGSPAEVSADKIIGGGDDADLLAALAATEGSKEGAKISFAQPDGEEKKKPVIKPKARGPEKKDIKTRPKSVDSDGEELPKSAIVATMDELQKEAEGTEDPEGDPGDEGEKGEPQLTEVEGFEEVDTNIAVGPQIKSKFKRFKANEKALKGAIASAEEKVTTAEAAQQTAETALSEASEAAQGASGGVEESDAYKAILKRAEDAEGITERLRLEESPRFKDKYDKKIDAAVKSTLPYIKAIKDATVMDQVTSDLNRTAAIPAGEENDPQFYASIEAITEVEGVPSYAKPLIFQKMVDMRNAINERDSALSEWRDEVAKNGGLDIEDTRGRVTEAGGNLKKIRSQWEVDNAERIGIYRHEDNREVFGYDAAVKPGLEMLVGEIQKSVETGSPTPTLLELAHAGAEYPFQLKLNGKLGDVVRQQQATILELAERVKKFQGGGTSGASPSASSAGEKAEVKPEDYEGKSGILQTISEMEESA